MKKTLVVAIGITIAFSALDLVPASAGIVYVADGLIAKGTGSFVGDDVYSTDGTGETVSAKAKPRKTITFHLKVQNDSAYTDSFTGMGCGSESPFKVSYYVGSFDVTAEMVAGTLSSGPMGAGGELVGLDLKIKVKKSATAGAKTKCPVTITSESDTAVSDTVVAKVTVK